MVFFTKTRLMLEGSDKDENSVSDSYSQLDYEYLKSLSGDQS